MGSWSLQADNDGWSITDEEVRAEIGHVGARLAREEYNAVIRMYRIDAFAGKPRSHQTTRNVLNDKDSVGANSFAKAVLQAMKIRRM
jgi:hypothetical protein